MIDAPPAPPDTATETIIEGLAHQAFAVVRRAFPGDFLDALAAEASAAWAGGDYRPAGVGRGADRQAEIRADHVLWLEPATATTLQLRYLAALEDLRVAVRRQLYLPADEVEAHFAVYPPGAFYHRHLDQSRHMPHRLVSCLLYLNRGWRPADGGQLRLYHQGPDGTEISTDVLPEHGTLVCFLSDRIAHEVLPTQRARTSLAAWLRRQRVL